MVMIKVVQHAYDNKTEYPFSPTLAANTILIARLRNPQVTPREALKNLRNPKSELTQDQKLLLELPRLRQQLKSILTLSPLHP